MSLYNMKENGSGYQITKFDEDLNPEATYSTGDVSCNCKAGGRPTCRHRQMLPLFQVTARVNTGWFYDFEGENWFFLDQRVGLVHEKRVKGWWRRA
jgi:hypothetical protein